MHRFHIAPLLLVAACGAAASHPGAAVVSARPLANSFAVRNVRVFDGERAIEHANVIVRDGLIAQISTAPLPDDLPRVDGAGRTLIPGLIDAHAHVQSERGLREALRFGVTTDLDMLTDITFAQTHARVDAARGVRSTR